MLTYFCFYHKKFLIIIFFSLSELIAQKITIILKKYFEIYLIISFINVFLLYFFYCFYHQYFNLNY